MAAVLEYMSAEVLELAGNVARDGLKIRIIPRHIMFAVRNDEELEKLTRMCTFPAAGVIPFIHSSALPEDSDKETEQHEQTEQNSVSQSY